MSSPSKSRPDAIPLKKSHQRSPLKQRTDSDDVPSPIKRRARRLVRFHHFGSLSTRQIEKMIQIARALQYVEKQDSPKKQPSFVVVMHQK